MTKLYICGKVTDDSDFARKFADAEKRLVRAGYSVVNPARIVPRQMSWGDAMRVCIKAMMRCDGVALLYDWADRKGATIEANLAASLDITVAPLKTWTGEEKTPS
jgi:hypothetical protein